MKDIKTFLIGFLSCACLFLFMGQTSSFDEWKKSGKSAVRDAQEGVNTQSEKEHKMYGLDYGGGTATNGIGRYAITSTAWDNQALIIRMDTQTGEITNSYYTDATSTRRKVDKLFGN